MKGFKECVLWGDMGADRAADQYPTEKVCKTCIRKFDTPDNEIIVSVGRDLGQFDASKCYFSDQH